MRFSTVSAVGFAFLATAFAAPTPEAGCRPGRPFHPPPFHNRTACITDSDADALADVFRQLIQEYSDELALEALTEDFVDYSSAVNIIMNKGAQFPKDITGPTFASRQEFMDGQGSQPQIPFDTLQVFHGCDSVSVRWQTTRSASGQPTEVAAIPVIGNGIIYAVPAEPENPKYNFRIKTLYSEFNTAAWLVNLGVFDPEGPVAPLEDAAGSTTKRSLAEIDGNTLRGPMI